MPQHDSQHGTALIMGTPSAATDLIGRRVRVWFARPVAEAIEVKTPVRYEGTVRAVGCGPKGLVMWVEQECPDAGPWYPVGSLFSACSEEPDGILLLPQDPP